MFSNENGGFSFNPGAVALQVWPTTDSWTNGSDPINVVPGGAINGGTFTIAQTVEGFTAS